MVLAGRESPIQTRELIYTGITRTSDKLDWLGSKAELERDLDRPVSRASGLAALLWGE
jgi:ATP-dependent exoDNAse (exonuclease V) alpha subunit